MLYVFLQMRGGVNLAIFHDTFVLHKFSEVFFSPTVSDELVILEQAAVNLSGCSQRLYMLLMHLLSVLFTGIMKVLSFTIVATILLALFIPNIDGCGCPSGNPDDKNCVADCAKRKNECFEDCKDASTGCTVDGCKDCFKECKADCKEGDER